MSICGLDFGTSNTTLGTIEGHAPVLAALETGQTTIPSAIFYGLCRGYARPPDAQPQVGARNLAD